MKITIIGNGNMAKGLAHRLLTGGHSVELHVRDQSKGQALADELKTVFADGVVTVAAIGSPSADVVIPTVHFGPELEEVARQYGAALDGKLVVDISNPVDFETFRLMPEPGVAGAEEIADLLPNSTVVKAFNTIFAGTLTEGSVAGQPLDVYIAGDDQDAKDKVSQLAKDGGLRPLDCGPLSNARHLEGFGLLHMTLQEQLGGSWMTGIKIVG